VQPGRNGAGWDARNTRRLGIRPVLDIDQDHQQPRAPGQRLQRRGDLLMGELLNSCQS